MFTIFFKFSISYFLQIFRVNTVVFITSCRSFINLQYELVTQHHQISVTLKHKALFPVILPLHIVHNDTIRAKDCLIDDNPNLNTFFVKWFVLVASISSEVIDKRTRCSDIIQQAFFLDVIQKKHLCIKFFKIMQQVRCLFLYIDLLLMTMCLKLYNAVPVLLYQYSGMIQLWSI